jgi:hypothetical protein
MAFSVSSPYNLNTALMQKKRNLVRVTLNDGKQWIGRIAMIASSSTAKAKKTLCLEIGSRRELIRIDDADIKEVVTAEFRYPDAQAFIRSEAYPDNYRIVYAGTSAP